MYVCVCISIYIHTYIYICIDTFGVSFLNHVESTHPSLKTFKTYNHDYTNYHPRKEDKPWPLANWTKKHKELQLLLKYIFAT